MNIQQIPHRRSLPDRLPPLPELVPCSPSHQVVLTKGLMLPEPRCLGLVATNRQVGGHDGR